MRVVIPDSWRLNCHFYQLMDLFAYGRLTKSTRDLSVIGAYGCNQHETNELE